MGIHIYAVSLWAEFIPAAAHFYREVVGLTSLPDHADDRLHFDPGGCYLTVVRGRSALPPDPEPRFPVVALSVSDLDSAIEKLCLYGVDLPWGWRQKLPAVG
jgi:hypothetical protein